MAESLRESGRSRLVRRPERGSRDAATAYALIDRTLVCHVAFAVDGQPFVIPATPWRVADGLYLHGAARSRLIGVAGSGVPLCVSFASVDALVFGGAAMAHSTDFTSLVLFGTGETVADPTEKARVLAVLVDKMAPGRSAVVRPPGVEELAATGVIRMAIGEGTVKRRAAPPVENGRDAGYEAWIGSIPLRTVAGPTQPVGTRSRDLSPPDLPGWLKDG